MAESGVWFVAILCLVYWISRDARAASKALRRRQKQAALRPDGDFSDVVDVPPGLLG